MPLFAILNQTVGPLPIKVTFNAPSDGPSTLIVAGSVWSTTANVMTGIEVTVDGAVVGSASIFSNLASTHRAVVPTYIPLQLTFGAHTLVLSPATTHTTTDYNDFFDAIVDY